MLKIPPRVSAPSGVTTGPSWDDVCLDRSGGHRALQSSETHRVYNQVMSGVEFFVSEKRKTSQKILLKFEGRKFDV